MGDVLSTPALLAGAPPRHVLARLKLAAGLIQSGCGFVKAAGGVDKLASPGMHLTLLSLEGLIAQVAGRIGFWPELTVNAEPDPDQPTGLPCTVGGGRPQSCEASWAQLEAAEACLLDCWRHMSRIEFSDVYRREAYGEIARMDSCVSAALGRSD